MLQIISSSALVMVTNDMYENISKSSVSLIFFLILFLYYLWKMADFSLGIFMVKNFINDFTGRM